MAFFYRMSKKLFFCFFILIGVALCLGAASLKNTAVAPSPKEEKTAQVSAKDQTKKPDVIVVDNFDKGKTSGVFYERANTIGAYQGTWARRPSYTIITKSAEQRRGDKGMGLTIDYKKEGGWCGWYSLLNGVDITGYNCLSFWVKGDKGQEKFDIGLADSAMQDLQIDAVYAGPVDLFLPAGVTTDWQEVKVPLARLGSQINLSSMGSLVLWFKYEGKGRIYIDDVIFKNDAEVQKIQEENAPRATRDPKHPRALWVWKLDPVNNIRSRKELLELCANTAIETIYLYFGEFDQKCETDYCNNLAEFLRLAHRQNLKVEGLTGDPVWSLEKNHKACLDWVKNFLEYNKARPPEERIDGVSLDVEPYLTTEWQIERAVIKAQYLKLLETVRALIDSYQQDFRLGVAIPSPYSDEGDFETKILGFVDYIALMDYYDEADKIIEKGIYHVELATKLGKKVIIGVETQDLISMHQGERRFTFFEEGWLKMEEELEKVKQAFSKYPGFEGFAIHCDYSYILLQKHKNVPTRLRKEEDVYTLYATLAPSPIALNGDLTPFKTPAISLDKPKYVVYGKENWQGESDLSAKAYLAWDAANLYLAFAITDNVILQKWTKGDMWQGDHVELWIDSDLEGDYGETVNSSDDFQIGLSPGNFKDLPAEVFVWTPSLRDEVLKKIEVFSKKTDTGYIIELKMPVEALKADALKKGMKMGVMIDPSDCDDEGQPQKTLMSSSPNRAWGDPTTFGVLELKE